MADLDIKVEPAVLGAFESIAARCEPAWQRQSEQRPPSNHEAKAAGFGHQGEAKTKWTEALVQQSLEPATACLLHAVHTAAREIPLPDFSAPLARNVTVIGLS